MSINIEASLKDIYSKILEAYNFTPSIYKKPTSSDYYTTSTFIDEVAITTIHNPELMLRDIVQLQFKRFSEKVQPFINSDAVITVSYALLQNSGMRGIELRTIFQHHPVEPAIPDYCWTNGSMTPD